MTPDNKEQTAENWEVEFESLTVHNDFNENDPNADRLTPLFYSIKLFIQSLLSKEYHRGREEAEIDLENLQYQTGFSEGKRAENKRLKAVAKEYKAKGFELETFIYSGFLPEELTQ